MNPILIRAVLSAVVIAGSALAAWLSKRNGPQLHSQRVNQTYTNWEPPPGTSSKREPAPGTSSKREPAPGTSSNICALCQDILGSDRLCLPCKHQLHLPCAKALYKERMDSSCPLCRGTVRKEFLILHQVC